MPQVACLVERRDHDADPRGAAVAASPAPGAPLLLEQLALGRLIFGAVVGQMLGDRGLDGDQRTGAIAIGARRPAGRGKRRHWPTFGRGSPIDDSCGVHWTDERFAGAAEPAASERLGLVAKSADST